MVTTKEQKTIDLFIKQLKKYDFVIFYNERESFHYEILEVKFEELKDPETEERKFKFKIEDSILTNCIFEPSSTTEKITDDIFKRYNQFFDIPYSIEIVKVRKSQEV